MDTEIRQATREDYAQIAALLLSASLPTEGVEGHLQHFLVAEYSGALVGAIGLEVYGETALLRSAAVSSSLRNKGLGTLLYDQLIEHAKSLGIRRLILLTTTAERFFGQKGFQKIDQQLVTGPIRQSVEFRGACPSTAVCMELKL